MYAATSEEKAAAAICHLVALFANSFLLGFLVPLVMLGIFNQSEFVRSHARHELNFQINLLVWVGISFVACFILIGFAMLAVLAVYALIMPILASLNAANGDAFHYPLTFPIIRG